MAVPAEETVSQKARRLNTELEKIDQTYFGKDRHKQIRTRVEEVIALLDTQPIDLV